MQIDNSRNAEDPALARIVGESPPMQQVKNLIRDLARFPEAPVIVTGETGAGKELVVDALQALSPRASKPFIKVNSGAIPDGLFESQFFGHAKGAFSGAMQRHLGFVEAANEGTLFLDEISCLKMEHQAKILRFAENGAYCPVGQSRTQKSDVWIIAATNGNLEEMVENGEFREDFYYRLKASEIRLPPLRERPEDIPLLIRHFIREFSRKYALQEASVPDLLGRPACAGRQWLEYPWPGNVRELKFAVRRFLTQPGRTPGEETQRSTRPPDPLLDLLARRNLTLEELQRIYIRDLYKRTGYKKNQTAKLLGLSLNTLKRKLNGAYNRGSAN